MIKYQILESRAGEEILEIDGIKLNSLYDPRKEARRFVERSIDEGDCPTVILISGAVMGYIASEAKKKYPRAKVLSVYYTSVIYDMRKEEHEPAWYPGTTESLARFLRTHINEFDIQGLKVLEWQPSAAVFPQGAKKVADQVSFLLKEYSGNFFTTCAMGKLWLKNSFYNWVYLEHPRKIMWEQLTKPVLIAGSGPSLEATAEWVEKYRYKVSLWALPSAGDFLLSRGLEPDFVVMTDPGYWSIPHLNSLRNRKTRLIMPISAARGSWRLGLNNVFIKQSNFFEEALLDVPGLEFPRIDSMGTVAASAVALALKYTTRQIFVTGLDFCYQDIQSHAAPNLFHKILEEGTGKLNPFYNNLFKTAKERAPIKEQGIRTSKPLMTYEGWFARLPESQKGRILNIDARIKTRSRFFEVSGEHIKLLLEEVEVQARDITREESLWPPEKERREKALSLLGLWRQKLKESSEMDFSQVIQDKLILNLFYFTELSLLNKMYHQMVRNEETGKLKKALFEKTENFFSKLENTIRRS